MASSSYSKTLEVERRALIEELLEEGGASPLISIACREGVLFATTAPAGFRKVRLLHPKGLYLGGIGESDAIELMAESFTRIAHDLWLSAGDAGVTTARILSAAERQPNGALRLCKGIFADRRLRPVIAKFVLVELDTAARTARLSFLSGSGERGTEESRFLVLGSNALVKAMQDALRERLVETPSFARAASAARAVWEQNRSDVANLQCSIVRFAAPERISALSA